MRADWTAVVAAMVIGAMCCGVNPPARATEPTTTMDPRHPIPPWITKIGAMPPQRQWSEFERMDVAAQVEWAITMVLHSHPPNSSFLLWLAKRRPREAVEYLEAAMKLEPSDLFVYGLLDLLVEASLQSAYKPSEQCLSTARERIARVESSNLRWLAQERIAKVGRGRDGKVDGGLAPTK